MPFRDPIVAGETLVRDAIQSEGYVAGISGWSIERDGDAEFNDVDIRGTVDVVGPDYPSDLSRIRLIVAGARPVIQLDDNFGRTYEIGADDNALYLKALSSPNSRIALVHDLGIAIRSDAVGAPSVLFDDTDGRLKVGAYSPWSVDGWQPITIISGSGFGSNSPEARMLPDGTVICRGGITGHSTVVGTQIATLPVGLRPARSGRWVCATEATTDNNHIGVTTAGVITIAKAGANNSWFTNLVFSTI